MPIGQSTFAAIIGGELAGEAINAYQSIRKKPVSKKSKRITKAIGALAAGGTCAAITMDAPGAVGTLVVAGCYATSDVSLAPQLIGVFADPSDGMGGMIADWAT